MIYDGDLEMVQNSLLFFCQHAIHQQTPRELVKWGKVVEGKKICLDLLNILDDWLEHGVMQIHEKVWKTFGKLH